MLILIWTLTSICFGLMCGCLRLMDKLSIAEREIDELVKKEFELESELFYLKRPRIEFDQESA